MFVRKYISCFIYRFIIYLGWNCALTGESYGDAEYAAAWERLLMPVAAQFDPQVVIVSAGFDSAKGDPEGELGVTPDGSSYLKRCPLQRRP